MPDDFRNLTNGLSPAHVFNWTGKFDPEEGVKKLRETAHAVLSAMDTLGGMLPDEPEMHQEIAHAVGLPGGKSFRLIRDSLVLKGMVERGNSPEGPIIMLTTKGRIAAQVIKKRLVDQGIMDPKTEQPIAEVKEPKGGKVIPWPEREES